MTPQQWEVLQSQAKVIFASGIAPREMNSYEKVLAVILKGHEMGLQPIYSITNILLQNGKVSCSAEVLQALIYRDHGDFALQVLESSDDVCTIAYKRRSWELPVEYSFTISEAKRAGLATKDIWQKYTKALLRARCVSAIARMSFADSIGGMYTHEELDRPFEVDDTGETQFETSNTSVRRVRPGLTRDERTEAAEPAPDPTEASLEEATPEQLEEYSSVRARAVERGFKTGNGNAPPEYSTGESRRKVIASTRLLREWLTAQDEAAKLSEGATSDATEPTGADSAAANGTAEGAANQPEPAENTNAEQIATEATDPDAT